MKIIKNNIPIYINGATCISPQNTLDFNEFSKNKVLENENEFLQSVKIDYKPFMKPIEARRMSKNVKNGIVCSHSAMQQAKILMPDAIIVGTGLGIITDTEKFLEKMIDENEEYLTPTSFIQSTHNTVAAQIALRLKCHNYNFTYVNRGNSFESAIIDSILHINEGKNNVLAGSSDEMTKNYFKITSKTRIWKTGNFKNTEILNTKTSGAISGEGTAFFVISGKKTENSLAQIKDIQTIYKPDTFEINSTLQNLLSENNSALKDIDLVIFGHNGDFEQDKLYLELQNNTFSQIPQAYFKHLSGEYQTSVSFALWLASNILKTEKYPDFIRLNNKKPDKIRNILIYNHFLGINHTFILLSKV